MPFAAWQATIVDDSGNVVPSAEITVLREIAGQPPAQCYSDRNGTTPIGSTFNADSEGFVRFFVAGGAYQITATSGSFSRVWRYVAIGTAAEVDSDFAVIADLNSTRGDLIRGGETTWEKLPLGTSGYHIISDGTDVGWAGFLQSGTGAAIRTWQNKARDFVSVLDFIPESEHAAIIAGTSTTDLTAYFQAAIDYVETFGSLNARPAIFIPAGIYHVGALVCDEHVEFFGMGRRCTIVRQVTGATDPMFTLNAENVGGSSNDDVIHYAFSRMSLFGNRTNLTPGTAHCLYFPDTAWSITTQYSPSAILHDLEIAHFTGDNIHVGVNRNWIIADGVISRYCNISAWASWSYDNVTVNCAFGVSVGFAVRFAAGGNNRFVNFNIFSDESEGATSLVRVESGHNVPSVLCSGSIDRSPERGVEVISATAPITLFGVHFTRNSASVPGGGSPAGFADIYIEDTNGCKVIGCDFIFGDHPVEYLLQTAGSVTDVHWAHNHYSTGTAPFATSVTNDLTKLLWLGDASLDFRIRPTTTGPVVVSSGNSQIIVETTGATAQANLRLITPNRTVLFGNNDGVGADVYGVFDITGGAWRLQFDYTTGNAAIGGNFDTNAKLAVDGPIKLASYVVASLPAGAPPGSVAYASNGRKAGEGGGAGTGVLVFKDGSAWRACDTGATVAA